MLGSEKKSKILINLPLPSYLEHPRVTMKLLSKFITIVQKTHDVAIKVVTPLTAILKQLRLPHRFRSYLRQKLSCLSNN